jgi:hypothetical protein
MQAFPLTIERTMRRSVVNQPSICKTVKSVFSGISLAFVLATASSAQSRLPPNEQNTNLDFSVWAAGETGEETSNSFAQAQVWTAGVFAGIVLTDEIGKGWRRGRLEYGGDFVPIFETYGNQRTRGIGFDPVILRWNSALHTSHVSPYIELSGGGVWTPVNLPPGRTSDFNFMAKGGGGLYIRTRPHQAIDFGLHWSHISNANLGADNYEFNGIQLSVAYHFFR